MILHFGNIQIMIFLDRISIENLEKNSVFEWNSWSGFWYSPDTTVEVMHRLFRRK